MRTIQRGPRRRGEHPWLRAFRMALAREDLAALSTTSVEPRDDYGSACMVNDEPRDVADRMRSDTAAVARSQEQRNVRAARGRQRMACVAPA